jgi:hypothetical protein
LKSRPFHLKARHFHQSVNLAHDQVKFARGVGFGFGAHLKFSLIATI